MYAKIVFSQIDQFLVDMVNGSGLRCFVLLNGFLFFYYVFLYML